MSLLGRLFGEKKQQPKQAPEARTEQNRAEQVQSGESEIEAITGLRIFLDNNLNAIESGTLEVLGDVQFRRFEIIRRLKIWNELSQDDQEIINTYIKQAQEGRGYNLNVPRLVEALRNLLNLLREEEKQYRREHR